MNFTFYKYQGTGNDFVIIDNRDNSFKKSRPNIAKICDRRFGIGADGFILLENDDTTDFKMVYFNADGNESSMCGNGGRCIVAFANKLGIIKNKTTFNAIDGLHHATINNEIVALQMVDVSKITSFEKHLFTNTGSPHHVQLVNDIQNYPVVKEGRNIRNTLYGQEGSNINFVEKINDHTFKIRTYERGVEDETLACGTGATAVAIGMHKLKKTPNNKVTIEVEGGTLEISFNENNGTYSNIFLEGPANFVFKGSINI